MLPFVLMRRDVARGTERCIGVGQIYDQYEEAKQPRSADDWEDRRASPTAVIATAGSGADLERALSCAVGS